MVGKNLEKQRTFKSGDQMAVAVGTVTVQPNGEALQFGQLWVADGKGMGMNRSRRLW